MDYLVQFAVPCKKIYTRKQEMEKEMLNLRGRLYKMQVDYTHPLMLRNCHLSLSHKLNLTLFLNSYQIIINLCQFTSNCIIYT